MALEALVAKTLETTWFLLEQHVTSSSHLYSTLATWQADSTHNSSGEALDN